MNESRSARASNPATGGRAASRARAQGRCRWRRAPAPYPAGGCRMSAYGANVLLFRLRTGAAAAGPAVAPLLRVEENAPPNGPRRRVVWNYRMPRPALSRCGMNGEVKHMITIPIKTKFDGRETDVVVTVRGFRLVDSLHGGVTGAVMLDDYDVAYANGAPVPAEILDRNDTVELAVEELLEECIVPAPAPAAISHEQDVANKLGKSAGIVDGVSKALEQLPVMARPREWGHQLDELELVKGALLDGKALIEDRLLAPAGAAPATRPPVQSPPGEGAVH